MNGHRPFPHFQLVATAFHHTHLLDIRNPIMFDAAIESFLYVDSIPECRAREPISGRLLTIAFCLFVCFFRTSVQITIIIKGGSDCAPERTYEAAVDAVPASFVDGSQWSGPAPTSELSASVRIVEKEAGRHVEIQARHLGAVLIVRQVRSRHRFLGWR